ncbi:zinc finger protein 436-like isoform X3 [Micropterus salmoides]|uniref:zinc finger protein 436-like isoform X3 n=1 Tax=Micropterus salmoides TaxID=27706 RepID=UPI0018EB2688|nr:zinc finger protein 436-like isoform X3 [Micropterus salmoides]
MVYCAQRNSGGSGTPDSPNNMSKTEILRGIVTEKLTTAAQEIFAVVERTVAGYEEEASGLRQEIDRQRRQLEAVLQPRVKLERRDLIPDPKGQDAVVREEEHTQQSGEEDIGNLGQLWYDDDEEGDVDNEEQQLSAQLATSLKEDLKDPDYQLESRHSSVRRKPGRPSLREEPDHHLLRVCVLEDSQSDVLSKNVFQKYPVQELQCPRGLQEADFLDLLRSTFPQLAGDNKPFDVFKSNRSRRLQRLKVKTLTPEEIFRSIRLTGAGYSALYIRLKQTGDEEEEEELRLLQRNNTTTESSSTAAVVIKSNEAGLSSSCPVQHVEGDKVDVQSSSSISQQQDIETEEADDENAAESQVDSSDDADKDGDEVFNGDDDWKPDPELQSPKKRRKKESKLSDVKGQLIGSSKTPCKVCGVWYRNMGSLINHAWSHVEDPQLVCGVCGEQFESVEELKGHFRNDHKTHDCSYCGKSFLTISSLNSHTTLHTGDRPFKCDVCHKTFAKFSTLNAHRWVHVADKPHKCDICLKAFGLKTQLKAHIKMHAGRDKYHCNVCGKSLTNRRSLTRHKTTHSGERRYGCEVCGKRFKLPSGLKSHEKIHTSRDRPYLCHICCKTFVENSSLKTHMITHSNERPFICSICSKGFVSNARLNLHMRAHSGEAPYSCSECGRLFKHKSHLNDHVRTHLGIKRFVCGVCGKASSRQEHLKVHMRTHNGEKPYQCSVCDKAFTQSHCLKTHMKSHQGKKTRF